MSGKPVLLVAYDQGSASPTEIAASLGGTVELVFVTLDSDRMRALLPVLSEFGQVVRASGDIAVDAAVLRGIKPSGLVTFSELTLRFAARLAAELGLPFNCLDTVHALTDKFEQRARLQAAGVDAVRCARMARAEDWWPAFAHVGMPAVVKPAMGVASKDTYLIANADAARHLYKTLHEDLRAGRCFVAEEFLRGRHSFPYADYVSVESLCSPGSPAHLAVTGNFPLQPPFRECGHFWPAPLSPTDRARVLDLATDALAALGVQSGITHTEVKLTEDGPRIIEVNGRLGGNLQDLALRSGSADLVLANGLSALGETVQVKLAEPSKVYFQYIYLAPTQPCRMTAAHGIRTMRKIPGITGYRATVRPGDWVGGGVGTNPIGQLYGVADDHESMLAVVGAALSELSFDFIKPDGDEFTLIQP